VHGCIKAIEDIAGGLLITVPTYKDFQNPETKGYIEKYLGGKKGVSTEARLRMLQLIRRRLATFETEVLALHAEGSLQAQRMTIYAERAAEVQKYKQWVEMAAGIKK
jgi:4-hydroxybutyryl-CoA dehydratase/vinylacetyl-CoA-Delta-isomerase